MDTSEHHFSASIVRATPTRAMHISRRDHEVEVAVTRDGQPFQTFVIVAAKSLVKAAGGDKTDSTAEAIAISMEPTIRQMIADGTAPAPSDIELRLEDEAMLAAALRGRGIGEPEPRFA